MQICEVEVDNFVPVTDKSVGDDGIDHDRARGYEDDYVWAPCERGKVLVMLCPAHSHCVRPEYEDEEALFASLLAEKAEGNAPKKRRSVNLKLEAKK